MAGPITWRNVGATAGTGGIAGLVNSSQRAAEKGFGALQNVLDGYRETEDANYEQGNKNVTNDFMKQLYSYKNNDDFQTARESGALQEMLAATGNRGDQKAMLEALDSRGGDLRARDTERFAFEDAGIRRDQRDTVAAIRAAYASGNDAEAQRLIKNLQLDGGKMAVEARDGRFAIQDQSNQNQETRNSTARVGIARANSARAQRTQDRQFADLDRQKAERDRLKSMDRDLADATADYTKTASEYADASKAAMVSLGLAKDKNSANPTALSDEQKASVKQMLEGNGYMDPGSATEARNRTLAALDGKYDLGASEVSSLSSSFESTLGGRNTLSASEQAKLEQEHALDMAAFEKQKAENPLYRDPNTNVSEEREKYLAPVIDSLNKGGGFKAWFGNEREQVGNDFTKWTTGRGFPLVRNSTKDSNMVQVPPKLWLEAWKEAEAKSDPEDHVEDILREKLNNLNVAKLQLKSKETNDGILQSNANYQQRLLNGNKAGLSDSDIMRALR